MTQSFVCEYCGTHYSIHQPHCSSCGASLRNANPAEQAIAGIPQRIRQVCEKHEDLERCHTDATVPTKKLRNAREALGIPEDEKVVMLCDDTVLGSSELGFAICQTGIFWKNAWSLPTKRKRLTWSEFAQRDVRLEKTHIGLGRGDKIGVGVVGNDECRERVADMRKEIGAVMQPLLAKLA